jgi:steroid 5-alpha reductase family enzyme
MTSLFPTLLLCFALLSALWPLSLLLKDVSIVDVIWGPAFATLGWAMVWLQGGVSARGGVTLGLVTLWGMRLGLHILLRRMASGKEDHRYTAIRRKFGTSFPFASLFVVFWLQALLLWTISWPLQAAVVAQGSPNCFDGIGWAAAFLGIVTEAVADAQLSAFRALPRHDDSVLDTGLWRWTRHPNYFGDFLIWWGFFVSGLSAGAPWWTVLSPIVMSALLMHFSGTGLMEETITGRRPAYRAYMARTSAFFPWPPGKG